ncbi:MAG: hypothetical protein IIT54_04985 [Acetobacter sp.]|nr:hypothetical protein [Acetobacter sp.]
MKIGEKLRDWILNQNTRRVGQIAEDIIQKLFNLEKGHNQYHDLYDPNSNSRIEVKSSIVQEKHKNSSQLENVIKKLQSQTFTPKNRYISFNDWQSCQFDCNIQQIKRDQFEVLYYVLFFYDKILIFRINSVDIGTDDKIFYSNIQHLGNEGEGQFHINEKTLAYHYEKYLERLLEYSEIVSLFPDNQ